MFKGIYNLILLVFRNDWPRQGVAATPKPFILGEERCDIGCGGGGQIRSVRVSTNTRTWIINCRGEQVPSQSHADRQGEETWTRNGAATIITSFVAPHPLHKRDGQLVWGERQGRGKSRSRVCGRKVIDGLNTHRRTRGGARTSARTHSQMVR